QGGAATADCTIQMTAADFKDMLFGNLNPTAAFMSGKLKVMVNLGLAMKLHNVLGQYETPRARGRRIRHFLISFFFRKTKETASLKRRKLRNPLFLRNKYK